jgi:sec-independent protein translocase protein TatA
VVLSRRGFEGAMGNIGISELVVILLILMLVFGASRLPALGEGLGKALRTFKRGVVQNEHIEVSEAPPKRVAPPSATGVTGAEVSDAEVIEETKRR